MSVQVRLDSDSVEAIARRVAELLDSGAPELIDATAVARRFGVSRDFVYEHATELGAVKLGDGRRARLRFDPTVVADHLAANRPAPDPPARPPARRQVRAAPAAGALLPIKGPS